MRPATAIEHVRRTFQYRKDQGLDDWAITDTGDCEDFVLSVLNCIWGRPSRAAFWWKLIVKADARVYYCEIQNGPNLEGHAVGWINGSFFDLSSRDIEPWPALRDRIKVKHGPVRYTRWNLFVKLMTHAYLNLRR